MNSIYKRPTMKGLHRQPHEWLMTACEHGWMEEIDWLLSYNGWNVADGAVGAISVAKHFNQLKVVERLMQDVRIANRIANPRPFVHRSPAQMRQELAAWSEKRKADRSRLDEVADNLPLPFANYTLQDIKKVKHNSILDMSIGLRGSGLPSLVLENIANQAYNPTGIDVYRLVKNVTERRFQRSIESELNL